MKKQIKQAELAPKYVLYIEGAGYLADDQSLRGLIFTDELELARKFSVGFDDPAQKLGIWNAEAKKFFDCDYGFIAFEAVYC